MIKVGMPTLMEFDNVLDNIKLAKKLQLDFVELNINMLYCYPKPEFRYTMLRYKKMYDIDFTMHYYDTVDVSSFNRNYQIFLFKDIEELAITLDGIIDRLVLHLEPGAFMTIRSKKEYVYKYDKDYAFRTIDNLNKIRNILRKYNIQLVVENVPIHPFMETLYKALSQHHFDVCWDIGHDVIYNKFLFSAFKEKYDLSIRHMHMHNVLDDQKDHQALSNGQLDIESYIQYAKEFDVHVVIEVKDSQNLKESVQYFNYVLEQLNNSTVQLNPTFT